MNWDPITTEDITTWESPQLNDSKMNLFTLSVPTDEVMDVVKRLQRSLSNALCHLKIRGNENGFERLHIEVLTSHTTKFIAKITHLPITAVTKTEEHKRKNKKRKTSHEDKDYDGFFENPEL